MARLLKEANALGAGGARAWRDHRRAAKKRARDIQYTRGGPKRVQLYRELIKITRATLAYLRQAAAQIGHHGRLGDSALAGQCRPLSALIAQIIAQTERRVLAG